jgi:hypothetical protein
MRALKLVVPAAALCLLASPALAEQASTSTATTNDIIVKGQQYEKKVVCRNQQNTGTRFATRVCYTNKVWDEMREQHLRAGKEMMNRPEIDITRGQ